MRPNEAQIFCRSVAYRHPKRRNKTNTIAARNTSAINDLMNRSTSRRMRVHQAATLVSRFDGSTSAISNSPSTTTTTTSGRRRITAAVYQPRRELLTPVSSGPTASACLFHRLSL